MIQWCYHLDQRPYRPLEKFTILKRYVFRGKACFAGYGRCLFHWLGLGTIEFTV
jgi:hypothetical protein